MGKGKNALCIFYENLPVSYHIFSNLRVNLYSLGNFNRFIKKIFTSFVAIPLAFYFKMLYTYD